MSDDAPLRLGVIGTGAISQVVHVPIFSERQDVDLIALADRDPHKAETLSRRFGVPLVMEAKELIDYEGLDAVVLCTPNGLHEAQAIAALESGKHVLVERPIALTGEGAKRVVDAAEASGRVLRVGLPHRFRPEVIALKDFVAGSEVGRVLSMHGSWMTRQSSIRSSWRSERSLSGGGALMDLGIAALDLSLWVLGYPELRRVSCVLGSIDDEIETSASLMAETVEGAAISLEVNNRLFAGEDRYHARVLGTDGSGSFPPLEVFRQAGGRPMNVTPRQPRPRGGENPYTNAYRRLLDDFVRCIFGTAEYAPPTEQPALMAIVEAAYRAAETGREVVL